MHMISIIQLLKAKNYKTLTNKYIARNTDQVTKYNRGTYQCWKVYILIKNFFQVSFSICNLVQDVFFLESYSYKCKE